MASLHNDIKRRPYDERKPEEVLRERDYLPILKMNDGTPVTRELWRKRREELSELLEKYSYGRYRRPTLKRVWGEYVTGDENFCAGKVKWERFKLFFDTEEYGVGSFPIDIYTPAEIEKAPVFLHIAFAKEPHKYLPIEEITDNGFATCVVDYQEMVKDVHREFPGVLGEYFGVKAETRGPEDWGKIGMWAWGASRVLDFIIADCPKLDGEKVAVIGHSRLGKTALWCGAMDERFAAVISNNSGYGGAASSKGGTGERAWIFNRYGSWCWFCENFKLFEYELEDNKPYDQSFLLAMIAPRYLLVGSAELDDGADPESEFLTALHASQAWELLGEKGLVVGDKMPKPGDRFCEGNVQYHLRRHRHYLSREDWNAYMSFLKEKWL